MKTEDTPRPCRVCGEIPEWRYFGRMCYLRCSGFNHKDKHAFVTSLKETHAEAVAEWNEFDAAPTEEKGNQ